MNESITGTIGLILILSLFAGCNTTQTSSVLSEFSKDWLSEDINNCIMVVLLFDMQERYAFIDGRPFTSLNRTRDGAWVNIAGMTKTGIRDSITKDKQVDYIPPNAELGICSEWDYTLTCKNYTDTQKISCGIYYANKEGKIIKEG